jgi:hypothetical protein
LGTESGSRRSLRRPSGGPACRPRPQTPALKAVRYFLRFRKSGFHAFRSGIRRVR